MQKVAALFAAFVLVCAGSAAAQAKLPVFFLRYSGGLGSEELEEDDARLEPASLRSSVSLRIKEELSRVLVGNLTLFYSTKDYFHESGDYTYFYLKPEISLELTDRVTLETEFRSKWVRYDEPDSGGESKDYLQLTGGIGATYQPVRGTRITGAFRSGFDLCENEEKSEQSYALGLRVLSRLRSVTLGASYRGTLRSPLGSLSEQNRSLMSDFGVSLTWDPNK